MNVFAFITSPHRSHILIQTVPLASQTTIFKSTPKTPLQRKIPTQPLPSTMHLTTLLPLSLLLLSAVAKPIDDTQINNHDLKPTAANPVDEFPKVVQTTNHRVLARAPTTIAPRDAASTD